jgi:hypothetical protein
MKTLCFIPFLLVLFICGCMSVSIPATNTKTGKVEEIKLFGEGPLMVQPAPEKITKENSERPTGSIIELPVFSVRPNGFQEPESFWKFFPFGPLSGDWQTQEKIGRILYSDREEGEPNVFYLHFIYSEW